ncbi:MAG: response regulator [Chloroflexi bacterium]|nr:MAG: response regulator [Chloroflexota bacterium]
MEKVLIVEDNMMIQEILSERLKLRGFDVVVASDGQEGIDTAVSQIPDIILMDVSLPLVDGWEATRQLKANESTKHIPIIALTAHALLEAKQTSFEAGCDDFETKPINFNQLMDKINTLLKSKQSE